MTVKIENESDGGILHQAYGFRLEMGAKPDITDNHSACISLVISTPEGSRREHPETGT